MSIANRVIKNTGFLYAKMGITMFISLYTTRLILNALGVTDFGIFNVVGGAIAMLGFLHAAMAGATQRFMSFYEGKGDINMQKRIFNISFVLHFCIALFVGILLLCAGYFFFREFLTIPEERIYAAKVVFGCLIISTMFTVMSVPYEAILNSHENMLYYSIVGVIESVLKLTVAIYVVYTEADKLIVYGVLMAIIPIIILTVMRIYCHKKYEECTISIKRYWDYVFMKEMTSFAGFNLLGASSSMITQYGFGVVLNSFFGPVLNAAQGVANQISGQLMVFSNNMMKAVNPVISKSEGEGNRALMLDTSLISCKFSYLLLAFFAIPFIIETEFILKVWLKNIPEWAVLFVRLQLLKSLVEQLTFMISRTVVAQGNIKTYTIVKSIINILPIIITYILFNYGSPPYVLYIVWIFFWGILGGYANIFFSRKLCDLKYSSYFFKVFWPVSVISLLMIVSGFSINILLDRGVLRLLLVGLLTTVTFLLVYYFFFITQMEKNMLRNVKNKIIKFKK
ncbi:MATE family efflux transporter [Zunongwangia sp. HGR-M22]|uniref:MATE family efflux transporter n=1 Tax=Zunongwangia sp. HGR-M22 TaxID=3015168 RepID=UPI0022DDFCB8|nr:MATE family efflux transporter [Zunongwangia sp. HGR-M22]WBL25998.1 hypothetical protein PBT91_01595 [Zunongwangia sp. HGR-M22]